jgi:hypothetical protein
MIFSDEDEKWLAIVAITLMMFAVLGIWKAIDIVIWMVHHLRFV